jgi:hypothetical protein
MSNNNSYTSGIISDENRYGYGPQVESRSQQQNRDRDLRSAAKQRAYEQRAYEQDSRDVADAVVADAVADAEAEAIEPQYHWCSGELFDLTVTSYNNIYGKEKILYSMMYGISSPIQKYLDEFYKIEKENIQKQANGDTPGDKDVKRALRQQFLELCNNNDYLKLYFRQMCNYLNGKTGKIDDQYKQPLTIVCAGGNLITIFFKLLLNIISTNLDSLNVNPNFNFLIGKITTYFATNPPILQFIKEYETKDPFIHFSDFDYNLVPYLVDRRIFNRQDPLKKQLNNQQQQGVEELLHNTFFGDTETTMGDMDGFILFRVKTRFKSVMDSIYRGLKYTDQEQFKEFKKACNENRDNNGNPAPLTNLYAQIVKDSEISKINSGNQLCKTYYNYLLKKKKYIKDATNLNVRKTIEYWKTISPGSSDLNSIIEYLHAVTTNLNKEIAYRQKLVTQYFDLFKSLNTMLVDDTLVEESSNILLDFMVQGNVNDTNYLHTNEIIESIHADENERTAVCGVPAKEGNGNELIHTNPFIRAVPHPEFGTLMDTIKIQPIYFKELGPVIPNDISIILNAIQTGEIDDPDVANDSPDISPIIGMSFGGKKTKKNNKNKKNNKKKSRTNKKKSRTNKKKSRTNKKKSRQK